MCGTNTCNGALVGLSVGYACCTGNDMTHCGLDFKNGQGCLDQSDAGFQPPMRDAGPPPVPDPSCGQAIITIMGNSFPLDGCCRPDGTCGYYTSQAPQYGCVPPDQLPMGTVLPDAIPSSCSPDGGK